MLGEIGVGKESAADILKALKAESVDALAALVGGDSDAIKEIKQLFAIANEYPPNSRAHVHLPPRSSELASARLKLSLCVLRAHAASSSTPSAA